MKCFAHPLQNNTAIFFLQLKKIFSTEKENITFAVVMNEPNPILAFTNTQNFDYYNGVIGSFVFEETEPVVYSSYNYAENGVLYCASATEKGVYWYSYCLNNPLKYTDPTGQRFVDDEWDFNKETGTFTWVSDRGRDECVDYYNVFERQTNGEMYHTHTKILDRTTDALINSFRISETENSTISAFHMPDTDQSGFFLEPKGPSTTVANQNQRIPEGAYNVEDYSSKRFPNVFRVYNESVSQDRRILIHTGNYPKNTIGCLLPGNTKGTDYVGNSKATLNTIRNFYDGRDMSTARLMIYNLILQP